MAYVLRRISAATKQDVWTRWRRGESVTEIANALARSQGTIFKMVQRRGGIPPRPRLRASRVLTRTERELIEHAVRAGRSFGAIGRTLRRAPSTISREVHRHGGRARYAAAVADTEAWRAAQRPKPCRLAGEHRLRTLVARKLQVCWSPRQIAGWLRLTYADVPAMQISHETIYQTLFVQSRGALKRELLGYLRRRPALRHARAADGDNPHRGRIPEAVSIRERPAAANDRAVPGHWEGDLLHGARQSYIATLVERQSRYVLLLRVPSKDTVTVTRALRRRIRRLPAQLRQSLTWDRGHELAAHRAFTVATNVQVYFCDPRSPWPRGSNENTNGLLRQYFPRGVHLAPYSQAHLNRIAHQLNTRPRETLGFKTPAAMLATIVATTA